MSWAGYYRTHTHLPLLHTLHAHPQTYSHVAVRDRPRFARSTLDGSVGVVLAMADLYTFDGPRLEQLKAMCRDSLGVGQCLAERTYVACTRAGQNNLWISDGGKKEYERTGICETCWDALMHPNYSDWQRRAVCNRHESPVGHAQQSAGKRCDESRRRARGLEFDLRRDTAAAPPALTRVPAQAA